MEKSNIQHLRDIIDAWRADAFNPLDTVKAEEFLEALADELKERDNDIRDLGKQIEEYEDEPGTTEVFLGLDTLHYRLDNGNLKIRLQLERWIELVKDQNCVSYAE